MKKLARAEFEIKNWDEKAYSEIPKLTRASITKTYKGDLEGEGALEYLMAYSPDGSASFVGMERFVGGIGEKRGSFVFQHTGIFKDGIAKSTWSVVPNSGTDDLKSLRGEVDSALGHGKSYPVELHYEFV